jgi:hypothetical protein
VLGRAHDLRAGAGDATTRPTRCGPRGRGRARGVLPRERRPSRTLGAAASVRLPHRAPLGAAARGPARGSRGRPRPVTGAGAPRRAGSRGRRGQLHRRAARADAGLQPRLLARRGGGGAGADVRGAVGGDPARARAARAATSGAVGSCGASASWWRATPATICGSTAPGATTCSRAGAGTAWCRSWPASGAPRRPERGPTDETPATGLSRAGRAARRPPARPSAWPRARPGRTAAARRASRP